MNSDEDALRRAVEMLERHGIPYMVTGSVASSYHGRPRSTRDADIVIDPTPEQLDALLRDFDQSGFYVDAKGARLALEQRRLFNAIDTRHASKIDLIFRKDRPFSHEEFNRRRRVDLTFARNVALVTAEDVVLSKLEWARRSGNGEQHLIDAAGVIEMNPGLDRAYIDRWATALGVADLWRRLSEGLESGSS